METLRAWGLVVVVVTLFGVVACEPESKQDVKCDWEGGPRERCTVEIRNGTE